MCRVLSEQINSGAAEGDKVSGGALQFRVVNNEKGRRESKVAQCNNSQPQEQKEAPSTQPTYEQLKKYSETSGPLYFADLAILQLERIANDEIEHVTVSSLAFSASNNINYN